MNRAPSTIWILRKLGVYPNGYVRTTDGDHIEVVWNAALGEGSGFELPRKDARLLAKRINECLDATVKR